VDPEPVDGAALMRGFLAHSPFARELGLELDSIEPDSAELVLPFREGLATYGDVVHGGAICALVDVAATAAAWSDIAPSTSPQGATVGVTVDFLRAAHGVDLRARAKVVRRGRQLCFCDVEVLRPDEELVAKGLATYKLG